MHGHKKIGRVDERIETKKQLVGNDGLSNNKIVSLIENHE